MDPELKAMSDTLEALQGLKPDQQKRILVWLNGKLNLSLDNVLIEDESKDDSANDQSGNKIDDYSSLPDLFAEATAATTRDKILLIASYLHKVEDKKEFSSREINDQLKHLGHGVKNITKALTSLISTKPQLVIQTKKKGSSRQAQKSYKVTIEGFNVANGFLP